MLEVKRGGFWPASPPVAKSFSISQEWTNFWLLIRKNICLDIFKSPDHRSSMFLRICDTLILMSNRAEIWTEICSCWVNYFPLSKVIIWARTANLSYFFGGRKVKKSCSQICREPPPPAETLQISHRDLVPDCKYHPPLILLWHPPLLIPFPFPISITFSPFLV